MKYLCVGEAYAKDGKEKMSWKRIGEMFEGKNGKTYIKIYHMPGVLVNVFEADKKDKSIQTNDLRHDEDVPF